MEQSYSLEEALAKAESTYRLVLKYGQNDHPPLSSNISKLINLRELYVEDYNERTFHLPEEITQLKTLEAINFQCSQHLESLPEMIYDIKSLTRITTYNLKKVNGVSDNIKKLQNLRDISLDFQLTKIPLGLLQMPSVLGLTLKFSEFDNLEAALIYQEKDFGDGLINLGVLDLTAKKIEHLPVQLFKSKNFTSLSIYCEGNTSKIPIDYQNQTKLDKLTLRRFKKLDTEIGGLKNLRVFNISGYESENIDLDFSKMEAMEFLEIEASEIKTLPTSIKGLKNLRRLLLRKSKIEIFPIELSELNRLKGMDLEDCICLDFKSLFDVVQKSTSINWLTLKGTNLSKFQITKINKELKKNK